MDDGDGGIPMARQRFDISSKWLLHNQGKGALRVGGLKNVRRCQPMPGEIAQNRRYPDGLLQAFLGNDPKPHHVLVEIATYPERRALKQALDDLALAYSALGHLPELVMYVLRPKGTFRVGDKHAIRSKLGLSQLEARWRTVELWALSGEEFLAEGDVGIVPWVPLMHFDGPPEPMLDRCAERIEREAVPSQRTDLLVVAQVMAGLTFPGLDLLTIFGGQKTMIESPIFQKVIAEKIQDLTLEALDDRFGKIPRDVSRRLREIIDEKKLKKLNRIANKCTDLEAFREALSS
jgi:hypothetical protein